MSRDASRRVGFGSRTTLSFHAQIYNNKFVAYHFFKDKDPGKLKLTDIRNGFRNVILNKFSPDARQSGQIAIAGLLRCVDRFGDFDWTRQGFARSGQSDLTYT